MTDIYNKIHEYSLEEIMGERFGRYSKYIIQDRAIPDVRDGLKPVQRRILYAMYKLKITHDHDYAKSARTVGEVIGKYHPHGDTSVYDAMVRMSQNWKTRLPHIDMHGNNGSIDGDSAAAYRYTEARLSKISSELLKDIDKDTVIMAPNFDDKCLEPTVLPCKYPNMLVNGAMGISAGYATNMPPHNLTEAIDATIFRIDNPNSRLDTIMNIIKGPDFPTGGIIEGLKGIKDAYETGRGKIIVKSKTRFEKNKIIVEQIPYEVNKSQLVRKIDEIRIDKKIDGIVEVKDESDKDGLQITIDLKKEANPEQVLNYLLKNTDLQISYNFNNVAIVNRRPKTLGLLEILDAYICHQKEVMIRRTKFDLATSEKECHIIEGLSKALSILDEVIKTIRASKDKKDAKENLIIKYTFTEAQAEAIVTLQLYKLTNFDILELQEKLASLHQLVATLREILENPDKLNSVIKDELRQVKKEYGQDRITEIKEEVSEIKIDNTLTLPKEDVIVALTKDGYIKRVSNRSYIASNNEAPFLKENDYLIGLYNINTLDTILVFTNQGNYLYLPVHEIPETKWKELGKHISNIIPLNNEERIIASIPVYDFDEDIYITSVSKQGLIKRTKLEEFKVQRYSKPISMMKLKDNDELVDISIKNNQEILIVTKNSYHLRYAISEIPILGIKASGVKAISLKNDEVVNCLIFDQEDPYLSIITDKGTGKRVKISELIISKRANRGTTLMKTIKSNPSQIIASYIENSKKSILIMTDQELKNIKLTELPITDLSSNGTYIVKDRVISSHLEAELTTKNETQKIKEEIIELKNTKEPSLNDIDDRFMTIDDLLKDIEQK